MEGLGGGSWLDALPSHNIFDPVASHDVLAGPSSSTRISRSSSSFAARPLPPSPGASSIHDDEDAVYEHTSTIHDFNKDGDLSAETRYAKGKQRQTHPAVPVSSLYGAGSSRGSAPALGCIVRKTELALAVGRSVRLTSLSDLKARVETSSSTQSRDGSSVHKTLRTPTVDFDIVALVPSRSSRFLACVGRSQLVVLELPRKGWQGLRSGALECNQDPVGAFYHTKSSPSIAQVRWHHWAVNDATLLVLTSDGILREYDVLNDVEEPCQTVDFVRKSHKPPHGQPISSRSAAFASKSARQHRSRDSLHNGSPGRTNTLALRDPGSLSSPLDGLRAARSTFSFEDEGADVAVAFSFGATEAHLLDPHAESWGPFAIVCLMQNGDLYAVSPYIPKQAKIPVPLLVTLSAYNQAKMDAGADATEEPSWQTNALQQLKLLDSLLSNGRREGNDEMTSSEQEADEYIVVSYPPHLRNAQLHVQGPFLCEPAPEVLAKPQVIGHALDLVFLAAAQTMSVDPADGTGETDTPTDLAVLAVAWSDGRVDAFLNADAIEPSWQSAPTEIAVTLLTCKTQDVFAEDPDTAWTPFGRFVVDSERPDSAYLYHGNGAHQLTLENPAGLLNTTRSLEEVEALEIDCLLRPIDSEPTVEGALSRPIVFLGLLDDVYLGSAIFLLSNAFSLVVIPATPRIAPSSSDERIASHQKSSAKSHSPVSQESKPAYVAFPDSLPFTLPPLLQKRSRSPTTRFTSPGATGKTRVDDQGKLELTIDSLRFVGRSVEKLDNDIRELIRAANTVQERLELHLKELPRQVGQLHEVSTLLESKASTLADTSSARLGKVRTAQQSLERRADRLLQRLIDASQPELSAFERRWADELDRLDAAVGYSDDGVKEGGRISLRSRLDRAREQLEIVRPQLAALERDSLTGTTRDEHSQNRMGEMQRKQVELALSEESRLLSEARSKIERINRKLAKSRSAVIAHSEIVP